MLTPNPVPELKPVSEPRFATEFKLVLEPCATKLSFKTALRAAMDEIIALTIRHMEAVRERADLGVQDLFERHLATARDRKDSLLELYKMHTPDIIADRASRAAKAAVTKVTNVTNASEVPPAERRCGH
jgi:hypothetical protein